MGRRRLVVGLLLLVFEVVPARSFAGSISLVSHLIASPGFPACTNGIVFTGAFNAACDVSGAANIAFTSGQTVTGGATFTNPVNGQVSTVSLSGTGVGSAPGPGSTLTLGTQASMNLTNSASGTYRSTTDVTYSSQLDVSGLTVGTPYFFVFNFDLAGATSASGGGRAMAQLFVDISGSAWFPSLGDATWSSNFTGDATISTTATGSNHNFIYVRPNSATTATDLTIRLTSLADDAGAGFTVGGTATAEADFFDTLTLTSAVLTDFHGNVQSSGVTDVSGFVYGGSAPAANVVSEPAYGALVGLGLLLLTAKAHRRLTT